MMSKEAPIDLQPHPSRPSGEPRIGFEALRATFSCGPQRHTPRDYRFKTAKALKRKTIGVSAFKPNRQHTQNKRKLSR
jgi:hypothetical protein